jgi:hypothetical protein
VSHSCHVTRNGPLIREKSLFSGLYSWWRWRDSNPRPPEPQQAFSERSRHQVVGSGTSAGGQCHSVTNKSFLNDQLV